MLKLIAHAVSSRTMKSKKCNKCGKIIEGYNDNHVKFLLKQHRLGKLCKDNQK